MLQICSPCQPDHAPTLHCQANPALWTCQPAHAALTLQVSNLLPSKAVTWQGCNIANLPKSHTAIGVEKQPRALVKPPQLTGQRLPSYTNLHRVPIAGLACKTDLATARCCKSAAPTNLTMLQHCTVKEIQHFKLANLPTLHWHCNCPTCCQAKLSPGKVATLQICQSPTLQAFRLKAKQPRALVKPPQVTGCPATPICTGFQLQVLVAEQIWPLQDVAICSPCHPDHAPTLHCPAHAALTLQVSNLLSPDKVATLQINPSPHCKPWGWKQPRALVKSPQLTGQRPICRSCLQNRSGHCKMLQICSPYQPDYAPTLHCQGNLTLLQICQSPHSKLRLKATKSTGQTTPSHCQRLPSCTNLHRVPTAGLGCRTEVATARCCKSAATLTMLHCPARAACCTDTASFQLLAKQSCHLTRLQHSNWVLKAKQIWPLPAQLNLHKDPTAGLGRKQIWPLQDVGNLQPLPTSPCSNTALASKSNTLNLPTCPRCTDTASFQLAAKQSCHLARLQHCKSNVQHCKPWGWKQPRALSLARCCPATPICTGFQLSWK